MSRMTRMLLAGDIGGTKTLLGLFEPAAARPRPVAVRVFGTLDYNDLPSIVAEFLEDGRVKGASIATACFGVAGPVIDEAAELTNVPWKVDRQLVAARFTFERVVLLNDLQALACAVPVLEASEVHVLQDGQPPPGSNIDNIGHIGNIGHGGHVGNIALIAAGTGLGEAMLLNVNGRFIPVASEGGHADFSARTEREMALLRDVTMRYGRADVERVLSGPGLVNLFRITHETPCAAQIDVSHPDAPAAISTAALERRCDGCVAALDMFVEAYGAEAGNLALRTVATGGVFVGGGIAPKILPALANGAFIRAFRAKPPLDAMLTAMPVKVILNPESGLLGAAVFAASAP
jgi:glucokinase